MRVSGRVSECVFCSAAMTSSSSTMSPPVMRLRTSLSLGSPRRSIPSLHEVCKSGDLATFRKAILRRQSDVFDRDAEGQTPLHIAAYEGQVEMVHQLVFLNAHLDATDKRQWTPLHCAAAAGADALSSSSSSMSSSGSIALSSSASSNPAVSDAHLLIIAFLLDSGMR